MTYNKIYLIKYFYIILIKFYKYDNIYTINLLNLIIWRSEFMKKRSILLVALIIVIAVTLMAFPSSIFARPSETAHIHYKIISSPFNEPITIEENYFNFRDALNAAKNMAHDAMYRTDTQDKIATLNNEEFIVFLYDALFHRTPDASGNAAWLDGLNNGLSRSSVIDFFINSPEFEIKYVLEWSWTPTAEA
jgi:hypothetical protein